jgi:hypothetical protein
MYYTGTLGRAKEHLNATSDELDAYLKDINGEAYVAVCKALVTKASVFIPDLSSYIIALSKIMKQRGEHETPLEGIMPPPLNLIISNVPGPRETRYFNGAELLASWPVSGIAPMTVINVTVYSYAGDLYFGLISARRAIPHLQDLKLCIDEVFAEFQQAIVV